mmetsp:Transcript_34010/g.38647  ORF Transcript_34010/g.38647 Transcript_34010/m.38647 type:complete len:225 (-) Transcript_34010:205-879(-)
MDSTQEALINACAKGNVDEIRNCLDAVKDVNFKDSNGCTPLFHACLANRLEAVRTMVHNKADPRLESKEDKSCLEIAVENSNKEIILLLLVHGADPTKLEAPEELSTFINSVAPDARAFGSITVEQRDKLASIFDEIISVDHANTINLQRSSRFNQFMEDISEEDAEKDAQDFISSCALCNNTDVNLDEWLFAFAKLSLDSGPLAVENFIREYDNQVGAKGKFT